MRASRRQTRSSHSSSTRRTRPGATGYSTITHLVQKPIGPAWPRRSPICAAATRWRSEEHTSELQSLMRISYAVFCLKKKKQQIPQHIAHITTLYTPTCTHIYH